VENTLFIILFKWLEILVSSIELDRLMFWSLGQKEGINYRRQGYLEVIIMSGLWNLFKEEGNMFLALFGAALV